MNRSLSAHLLDQFHAARAARMPFGQPLPQSQQLVISGPMSYAPQMHGSAMVQQPFTDHSVSDMPSFFQDISESTAQKIAELQAKLDKKLGPEFISQRPGPGGNVKLTYAEGWKVINLANEVFGFNGWSSNIVNLNTDFVDYNEETKKYSVGVSAVIRVTLRDGVYHEDVGYGMLEGSRSKGAALDKCKKEAVTDGVKRALRNFGNLLGNCLYDKQYTQEIVKMKVPPAKFDKSALHRRPEFQEGSSTGTTTGPAVAQSTMATRPSNDPVKPVILPKAIGMNSFSNVPNKAVSVPHLPAANAPAQHRPSATSTPLRTVTPQAVSGTNKNGDTIAPLNPQKSSNAVNIELSGIKPVNQPTSASGPETAQKSSSTEMKTAFKPLQDLARTDTFYFDSDEDEEFLAALEKAEGDAIYNDFAADLGRPIDGDEGVGSAVEVEEEAIYVSSSDEKTMVEDRSRQTHAAQDKTAAVSAVTVIQGSSNLVPQAPSRSVMQPRTTSTVSPATSVNPATESEDEIARQIIALRQKRKSAAAATVSVGPHINENVLAKSSVQNVPAQPLASSKPPTPSMGGFNFPVGMKSANAPLSSGMRLGQTANVQSGPKKTVDVMRETGSGVSYANAQAAVQAYSGVRQPFARLDDRPEAYGSDAKRFRVA